MSLRVFHCQSTHPDNDHKALFRSLNESRMPSPWYFLGRHSGRTERHQSHKIQLGLLSGRTKETGMGWGGDLGGCCERIGSGCWGGLGSASQTGDLHPGHRCTPLGHSELPKSGRKPVSESWPRQRQMRAWLLALAVTVNGLRSHTGQASV